MAARVGCVALPCTDKLGQAGTLVQSAAAQAPRGMLEGYHRCRRRATAVPALMLEATKESLYASRCMGRVMGEFMCKYGHVAPPPTHVSHACPEICTVDIRHCGCGSDIGASGTPGADVGYASADRVMTVAPRRCESWGSSIMWPLLQLCV